MSNALTHLSQHVEDLRYLLQLEREALRRRDVEQLAELAEAKRQLCEQIAAFPQTGMEAGVASDADHKKFCALLTEVRDFNLVNGKILAKSQQFVREAITVLSGKTLDGLYGHSGQPTTDKDSGPAIARA